MALHSYAARPSQPPQAGSRTHRREGLIGGDDPAGVMADAGHDGQVLVEGPAALPRRLLGLLEDGSALLVSRGA